MNKAQSGSPFRDFENWLILNGLAEEFFCEEEEAVDLEIVTRYAQESDGAAQTLRLEL